MQIRVFKDTKDQEAKTGRGHCCDQGCSWLQGNFSSGPPLSPTLPALFQPLVPPPLVAFWWGGDASCPGPAAQGQWGRERKA